MADAGGVQVACPVCSELIDMPVTVSLGAPDFITNEVPVNVSADTSLAKDHIASHVGEDTHDGS